MTSNRYIPSGKLPIIGHAHLLKTAKNGCFLMSLQALCNGEETSLITVLGQSWYIYSSPEAAKKVLVKEYQEYKKGKTLDEYKALELGAKGLTSSEGEQWLRQHRSYKQYFSKKAVVDAQELISKNLEIAEFYLTKNMIVDIEEFTKKLTYSFMMSFVTSSVVDTLNNIDAHTHDIFKRQEFIFNELYNRVQRGPLWKYLPMPSNFKMKKVLSQQRRYFKQLLESKGESTDTFTSVVVKNSQSEKEAIDQVFTFMAAGYESSASILTWSLIELVRNPEFKARALNEEDFIHNFVNEVLRLYPPFAILPRERNGEFHVINLYDLQTNPKWWGEGSLKFNPDRFSGDYPLDCFFPFGLGPRKCIGENLALEFIKETILFFITNYEFEIKSDHKLIEGVQRITRQLVNPVEIIFKKK